MGTEQDMLQEIFDAQMKLMVKYGTKQIPEEYDDFEFADYLQAGVDIKELEVSLLTELGEMNQALHSVFSYKKQPISLSEAWTRIKQARDEFIDVMHFVIEIALVLGFDADMLNEMYVAKNKNNQEREDHNGSNTDTN